MVSQLYIPSDVLNGNACGFLNGTKLGINQQAGLIGCGSIYKGVADRAVIGLFIVVVDPELDPCKGISAVLAKAKVGSVSFHALYDGNG